VDAAGVGGRGGLGTAEPGRLEHRPGHRALTGTQRNRANRCATSSRSVVGACGRARRPAFVLVAPPRGGHLPESWPAAGDRLGSAGSRLVHLCPRLSPARIRARPGSGAPILGLPAVGRARPGSSGFGHAPRVTTGIVGVRFDRRGRERLGCVREQLGRVVGHRLAGVDLPIRLRQRFNHAMSQPARRPDGRAVRSPRVC
jgi:hypothetical protein